MEYMIYCTYTKGLFQLIFQTSIFSFLTDASSSQNFFFPGRLACENEGIFFQCSSQTAQSQIVSFFQAMAAEGDTTQVFTTDNYISAIDNQSVITIAMPVVGGSEKRFALVLNF